MSTYEFREIERKWRAYWEEHKTFRAPNPGDPDFDPERPKSFIMDFFPYPSGKGLHVGHPLGYIATDIVSRYRRMLGMNVLHPMGFDAFGLPAEQYAIETGTHPRITTEKNIETMRRQLRDIGLSLDWDREISSIDPDYYKWTQWIFLQMFHSWVDPSDNKAHPIGELIERFEADQVRADDENLVAAGSDRFDTLPAWSDLDAAGREKVLGQFRIAYLADVPVNWCPALGTVLANEEVTAEGLSERGNHPVVKRPLEQWMLRITAFAERLARDLDDVDWPEPVRLMQRNWIGRSEGARVRFTVDGVAGEDGEIEIYTTRPDTLFGATYMVLAPEHPLVDAVTTDGQRTAVVQYRKEAAARSDVARQAENKEKTGVFTGGTATNPVSGESIPIWIADYVMMGYGTGAIMAVPGHDTRDFEFARAMNLSVIGVVLPPDEWFAEQAEGKDAAACRSAWEQDPTSLAEAFTGEGTAQSSANAEISLDGRPSAEAKRAITEWLEQKGLGQAEVQYKLRDWLFSRQRYWGEPFPILHGEDGSLRGVNESDLPVELPDLDDYRPITGDDPDRPPQPSLSRADESWRVVEIDGKRYKRELNTMPNWAGSCWYYLRYLDNRNDQAMVAPDIEKYWMAPGGVDLYMGGVEHAVLHLLYARFWHKALYDLGHVSTPEPFAKLLNQGYIQAYAYTDSRGVYVPAEEVVENADGTFTWNGQSVTRSTLGKMGKSLKNSVSPDEIIEQYGCDTLRLYEMYLGPIDQSKPWNTRAIVGVHRFLQRVWRNLVDVESGQVRIDDAPADEELSRQLHRTIADVTENMNELRFNPAIARLIELNNALVSLERVPREVAEALVLMLAPMAPCIAEELWERLGHEGSLARAPFPVADESQLATETMSIVVQVMGKKRGTVEVPTGADQATVQAAAEADAMIARHLEGKTMRKVIYVPGKLLNLVAN